MASRPIFKLHLPIVDDIKKKGLKTTLVETTDDVVSRMTAGLTVGDIRGVLRGDPAPKPNPRVKPHADGFWLHMRPTYFHNRVMSLYPTFRLGWLSVFFFVFEIITGLLLMVFYTPSPLVAYENMLNIMGNVPFGQFLRDLHKIGAEGMVVMVALHMLRTFVTGSYKKPRQFTWFTGMVLLMVTLFLSFSGYLLPWDQLSLWAVTIGASMVEAIPPQEVGAWVNLQVRGAPQFSENGLLRFYLLHVFALPLIGLIFTGVHYYKVIVHGHSLPPDAEQIGEDTARRVPVDKRSYFLPDVFTREMFLVFFWTTLMVFAVSVGNLFHAPLEPHANPLVTPLHTTAPWYFLWLQGMLKIGNKVLWGLVMPGVIFGFLFTLPYFELGPSRRYIDRRVGLSVGALVVAVLSILTFMGTPFYSVETSAPQEVVAALAPQTHPGELRAMNPEVYPLIVGEWDTTEESIAKAEEISPQFGELLHLYASEIERYKSLEGVVGKLAVSEWQSELYRFDFTIDFVGADGNSATYEQIVFLHEKGNYGGH